MSARRPLRALLALSSVLIWLTIAPPAQAAQRLVQIETPSRNVDPADVRFNGADHPRRLRANVLLPDDYDGRRRFPVLFLLHGVGDNYRSWASPSHGDVATTARGLDAIVVMPEAGRGFYANWWNGGIRGRPGWERFYLDELVPLVEERFRVRRGRRWHALAGISMGGLGAAYLGSQHPGYFGSVATFSGFVSHQRPEVAPALGAVGGVNYAEIFGPRDGFYASGHNPVTLVRALRSTRLYVAVGNGIADPRAGSPAPTVLNGGLVELGLRLEAEDLVKAARAAAVPVTYHPSGGIHDWPYWRRHLRDAIRWGLFEPVAERPANWEYSTVATRGEMWGLRYSFATPPAEVVDFSADGRSLVGWGSGGTVTVRNEARCGFSARLPFERSLPPAICGRLRVSVAPRRVRLGRTIRLRFRVRRRAEGVLLPVRGARLRLGRRIVRTDSRGHASLRYRPRGRPGTRRVRVAVPGLRSPRATLRVVR